MSTSVKMVPIGALLLLAVVQCGGRGTFADTLPLGGDVIDGSGRDSVKADIAITVAVPDLSVNIEVVEVVSAGGETTIKYRLTNSSQSTDRLRLWFVDAPTGVTSISVEGDPPDWHVMSRYRLRRMAIWGDLVTDIEPGGTSPILEFTAPGVPGVGQSWAMPYAPLPPIDTLSQAVPPPPDLLAESTGPTPVLAVELPVDVTPEGLFARLQDLLDQSCNALGWITNQGICNSLQVKLNAVEASLSNGNTTAAANELGAFANELEALNVKFISGAAYWLLKINAESLASQL